LTSSDPQLTSDFEQASGTDNNKQTLDQSLHQADNDLRRLFKEEDDQWVDSLLDHKYAYYPQSPSIAKNSLELTQADESPFNFSFPVLVASALLTAIAAPLLLLLFFQLILHNMILAKLFGMTVKLGDLICRSHILNFNVYLISATSGLLLYLINLLFKPPPTHLIITDERLVALRTSKKYFQKSLKNQQLINIKHTFFHQHYIIQASLAWESMVRLFVDPKTTAQGASILCFQTKNGKIAKLRLGDVLSSDVRTKLLQALKERAPQAEIEAEAYALLEPLPETSFTELWIAALSAPPSRERILPLDPGVRLNEKKYEIEKQLATGGQGTAYLAKAKDRASELVVLKEYILPIYVTREAVKNSIESLEHEARLLKKIDHAKIVKCLDFFVEDHRGYIVLEYVQGENLRDLILKNKILPEQLVLDLARQMCDILSYLHCQEPPIVHKDFTPDNLILEKNGSLKLIDFNIAQQLSETNASAVGGKAAYMAIEQVQGNPCPQTDLYAMGACLYFLLVGEDPEPISVSCPRQKRIDIDEKFAKLIARCTEPDLSLRYDSAASVRMDLVSFIKEG
jgi:tRNA A-37 threonylcarbamoyl transferase component Bud32